MKRSLFTLIIFVALSILLVPVWASASYVETFNSGNVNWLAPTVNNSGVNTYPAATWASTGGVGDTGYIAGTVSNAADRLYGLQAPFRTDPSTYSLFQDLQGKTLTVDYKTVSGSVTGPTNMMVRFYIGMYADGNKDYFVTKNEYSWNPNSVFDWTTYQVIINEGNFDRWPNQANGRTFAQVAAGVQDIGLVFADGFTSNQTLGFSGSATLGIDNFGVLDVGTPVPVPAAFWLLGSGLVGLIGMRRKIFS